jgi:hypothetical protein
LRLPKRIQSRGRHCAAQWWAGTESSSRAASGDSSHRGNARHLPRLDGEGGAQQRRRSRRGRASPSPETGVPRRQPGRARGFERSISSSTRRGRAPASRRSLTARCIASHPPPRVIPSRLLGRGRQRRPVECIVDTAEGGRHVPRSIELLLADQPWFRRRCGKDCIAFTEQASVLIANAQSFYDKAAVVEQLKEALETRDIIGTARGPHGGRGVES